MSSHLKRTPSLFSFLEKIRVAYKLNMRPMNYKANTVKYKLDRNLFNLSVFYTHLALTIISGYLCKKKIIL